MFAGHYGLGGLTVLLDANNSQVDGPVDSITTIEPIAAKWQAFGWAAMDLDGHDVAAIPCLRHHWPRGLRHPGPRCSSAGPPPAMGCPASRQTPTVISSSCPTSLAEAAIAELTSDLARLATQGQARDDA